MKKNIRKIPSHVIAKLSGLSGSNIVAASALTITDEEVKKGLYEHVGVAWANGSIQATKSVLPDARRGKFSRWNIFGREVKRRDLPKEFFEHPVESPNWGDFTKGTHTSWLPGERYPVDFDPPRKSTFKVEHIKGADSSKTGVYRFTVSEVMRQDQEDFEDRLLSCLNLLQENLGTCDVDASEATVAQYVKTHQISWEILPPGTKEEFVSRVFHGRTPTQAEHDTVAERYDFFRSLGAKEEIVGTSGFDRYFGARIKSNLVLFENVQFGNAVYIMYDNWRELSKRSRIELLSGRFGHSFDRVVHTGNWKTKIRAIIERRLSMG